MSGCVGRPTKRGLRRFDEAGDECVLAVVILDADARIATQLILEIYFTFLRPRLGDFL